MDSGFWSQTCLNDHGAEHARRVACPAFRERAHRRTIPAPLCRGAVSPSARHQHVPAKHPQLSRQDHPGAARRGRRLQVLPDSDRGAARRSRGHAAGRDGSCAGSRPDHADPGPGHRPVPAVRRRGGQAAHCQRRRREGARARGVPTRAASGHNGARRADRLPLLQEVPVLQRAVQHVVRVGRRGGGRVRVSCSP